MFATYGNQAAGFLEEDGRLWRAVVKATEDGGETFLVTLHRAHDHNYRNARRRFRQVHE